MTVALLVLGLILLILGAEVLVRGASSLATALRISPLVVGLTVVAFGTSSPELAVSVQSATAGRADLALGNVIGSNIFNVLLILGLSAVITPLVVSRQLVRLDVPVMIAVSVLLVLLALDGAIVRVEGALLFGAMIAYTVLLLRLSRRTAEAPAAPAAAEPARSVEPSASSSPPSWLRDVALVVAGLALLVLGSRWLVDSAVTIAAGLGVSQLVIGLTIVAAGTSLPEVATSIAASLRGERDIAVGNVVGSNIFNILAVLGLSALAAPAGIPVLRTALVFDMPIMVAVAVACLPVLFSGYRIGRREGALFLLCYVGYTAYLVTHAANHPLLPAFRTAMQFFALPLVALTLVVIGANALRERASR